MFSFASQTLKEVDFPYFLSIQNGAEVLEMPSGISLCKQFLPGSLLPEVEKALEGIEEDILIYAGREEGDFCYYRPHRFSLSMQAHVKKLQSLTSSSWKIVENFRSLYTGSYPLIKGLGTKKDMEALLSRLSHTCSGSSIKDPLQEGLYLALLTSFSATKGHSLRYVRSLLPENTYFIAAGDDHNDLPLLEAADYAIAMSTAPLALQKKADAISPPACEEGIVQTLQKIL